MNEINENIGTKTPATILKENIRKDCYGNIISKKLKKHKICFPDSLDTNKKIAEILNVDSYKYVSCKMFLNLDKNNDDGICTLI